MGGIHRAEFSATTTSPPGSEPGSTFSAHAEYMSPTEVNAQLAPMAISTQPILFRGWRWMSNAPTSGNRVIIRPNPTLARALVPPQSLPVSGLAMSRSALPHPAAMKTANRVQDPMRSVRSVSLMGSSVAQHPLQRGS